MNKEFIDDLCIQHYGIGFNCFIDKHIKQYLGNDNYIKQKKHSLVIYYLNCDLYDIAVNSTEDCLDRLFSTIESLSKTYILNKYVNPKHILSNIEEVIDIDFWFSIIYI